MRNIALFITYEGTAYHGWQIQKNLSTVQQTLQKAIEMVSSAVGDKEIPVAYLLGEQYVKAMQDMAKSNNAKTVVLPADILSTIRGVMGQNR